MSDKQLDDNAMIGSTIDHGRYEIIKQIGSGGMGKVFAARQVSINRMVALKILKVQGSSGDVMTARFAQEAQLFQKLRHPNTIIVHDFGQTEDGELFISMELLNGESLASLLSRDAPLNVARALHIMEQICNSVAEAHANGVIHRDLKPENIQIENVGGDPDFVKVLDFGIAKVVGGALNGDASEEEENDEGQGLTLAGEIFGTPLYMSPEQTHGAIVDHRTDIYSLGVILFQMLTGHMPFTGQSAMAIMMAHASLPPPDIRTTYPDLHIPESVISIIEDCLKKDVHERIQSAEELRARIQLASLDVIDEASALYGMGAVAKLRAQSLASMEFRLPSEEMQARVIATDESLKAETIQQQKRGHRTVWLMLALVLLLGAGALVWYAQRTDPKPPAEPVEPVEPVVEQPPKGPDKPDKIIVENGVTMLTFQITSRPPGAEIFDGDRSLGVTPLTFTSPEGQQRALAIRASGYIDSVITLSGTEKENERNLDIALMPQVAVNVDRAWFYLDSDPPGALVIYEDNILGETPMEWRPTLTGSSLLKFVQDGYRDEIYKVKLKAGGDSPERIQIKFKRKIARKPTEPRKDPDPPRTPHNNNNNNNRRPGGSSYEKL